MQSHYVFKEMGLQITELCFCDLEIKSLSKIYDLENSHFYLELQKDRALVKLERSRVLVIFGKLL